MTYIDVVAGIVFNDDQSSVLIALRKPLQHQGNLWEFPGGKLEPGESQPEALSRELVEEIGISPDSLTFRRSIEHAYSDKAVRLHFWDVLAFSGQVSGREGQTLQWVRRTELARFPFPAANQAIVDELLSS